MGKDIKSFRMGDLCEYIKVRKAKKNNVRTEKSHEFCIPVVYAKFGDNGIMYWGRKGEFDTHSNVISIVYNGAIAAGKVYAQEDETGILAEAYLVRVKNGEAIPFRAIQYLAFSIEKGIYPKYSRELLATWENRVENDIIPLPIQTDAEGTPIIDPEHVYHPSGYIPDWNYMQERIAKLEQERIAKLEQYLVSAGLNDYELNDEDRKILGLNVDKKSFRIGALFFSQNGNVDIQKVHINGKGNWVVSSGLANAGIIGRSDIPAKVFTPETITIDMFGNVFYRSYPYKMVTHARVFSLSVRDESITLNKGTGIFLSASLAFLNKMFSFSNMCTYDKIVDIDFWLPIQTDSEGKPLIDPECKYHAEGYIPDWDYMTAYIRAMQKVVIADVVKYKDEVIAKTRALASAE